MDTHDVRTIEAAEFKAPCLELIDEGGDNGSEVVITKNGHPLSLLVPYREEKPSTFGKDKDKIRILGNIIEPIGVQWDVETGETTD